MLRMWCTDLVVVTMVVSGALFNCFPKETVEDNSSLEKSACFFENRTENSSLAETTCPVPHTLKFSKMSGVFFNDAQHWIKCLFKLPFLNKRRNESTTSSGWPNKSCALWPSSNRTSIQHRHTTSRSWTYYATCGTSGTRHSLKIFEQREQAIIPQVLNTGRGQAVPITVVTAIAIHTKVESYPSKSISPMTTINNDVCAVLLWQRSDFLIFTFKRNSLAAISLPLQESGIAESKGFLQMFPSLFGTTVPQAPLNDSKKKRFEEKVVFQKQNNVNLSHHETPLDWCEFKRPFASGTLQECCRHNITYQQHSVIDACEFVPVVFENNSPVTSNIMTTSYTLADMPVTTRKRYPHILSQSCDRSREPVTLALIIYLPIHLLKIFLSYKNSASRW